MWHFKIISVDGVWGSCDEVIIIFGECFSEVGWYEEVKAGVGKWVINFMVMVHGYFFV